MSCFRTKAALINTNLSCIYLRTALFHATPVLERTRRNNHWQQRSNYYARRCRKINAKQTLLRNVNDYAEFLFQRWKDEYEGDGEDPTSDDYPSWFRRQYSTQGDRRRNKSGCIYNSWQTRFVRSDDEDDNVEHIFHSAFGGHRYFYRSFKENSSWQSSWSYSYHHGKFNNWSGEDEEFKFSRKNKKESKSESAAMDFRSERQTLGLSASDPLTLEVIKKAFQECAKKWHPDRHPSSSKVEAEEQFKVCNAAYESLRKVAVI